MPDENPFDFDDYMERTWWELEAAARKLRPEGSNIADAFLWECYYLSGIHRLRDWRN